jgi:cytoskeleton protein RodZ
MTNETSGAVLEQASDLARLREAKGITQEDIAQRLRMSAKQIRALEAGSWELLPGMAFVRAAIRSYSRLLEADPTAYLAALGHQADGADLRKSTSLDVPGSRRLTESSPDFGRRSWWSSGTAYALMILAGLIVLSLYFTGGKDLTEMSSWLKKPMTPAGSTGSKASITEPLANTPTASKTGSTAPPAPPVTVATAPATAPAPAPVVEAAAPAPVPADVAFAFSRESWVEVKDASGKVLVSEANKPGSTRNLTLSGKLALVIGNASGVKLTVRGKEFDLKPFTGNGDVARFSVE